MDAYGKYSGEQWPWQDITNRVKYDFEFYCLELKVLCVDVSLSNNFASCCLMMAMAIVSALVAETGMVW